jgi:hypothetical protein
MTIKTVLVPNAPWPKWVSVEPTKRPKKRAKPSEIDAKFEQWLQKEFGNVKRWR